MGNHTALNSGRRIGKPVAGVPHKIGQGFTARHFSEEMFGEQMAPLLMVDDFVMTAPTFAPHQHAGISAVTVMFEDSTGTFLNRDTLGNNIGLKPGDLYWLAAAAGAVHEEWPGDGARTHALQIFVNLPASLKRSAAHALHVPAESVPVLEGRGYRVRVVLGRSGPAEGVKRQPEDMTMLDGFLEDAGQFIHHLPEGHQAWVYAVSGSLAIRCGDEHRPLLPGEATIIGAGAALALALSASQPCHFVLIAARPAASAYSFNPGEQQ